MIEAVSVGESEGLGDGSSEGEGLGDGSSEGEGLGDGSSVTCCVLPETAARAEGGATNVTETERTARRIRNVPRDRPSHLRSRRVLRGLTPEPVPLDKPLPS